MQTSLPEAALGEIRISNCQLLDNKLGEVIPPRTCSSSSLTVEMPIVNSLSFPYSSLLLLLLTGSHSRVSKTTKTYTVLLLSFFLLFGFQNIQLVFSSGLLS
jgi:hypothetical protein